MKPSADKKSQTRTKNYSEFELFRQALVQERIVLPSFEKKHIHNRVWPNNVQQTVYPVEEK